MVTLLRHTEVAAHWRGRCYGVSDAGLSRAGIAAAHALARDSYSAFGGLTLIQASPLRRARFLGGLISRHLGLPLEIVPALRERDFGSWEGQAWDAIHAAHGDAMMGMVDAPARFRPGGGEMTDELARRITRWFRALPQGARVLAITHGGPVAALRGTLEGLPARAWLKLIPSLGEAVRLPHFSRQGTENRLFGKSIV
jgi:broad specificity phosphatase PhoE